MIGIYKITSPSGNIYIGQSRDIRTRFNRYRRLCCQDQPALFNSFRKYGSINHTFEILHELPTDVDQVTLNRYECFYIDAFKDCGFELLNIKQGGSNGKHSPKSIEKIKRALIGKKGHKHSPESREKIRQAHLGKNKPSPSPETRSKMRAALLGRSGYIVPPETLEKMRQARLGHPPVNKGKKMSEEQKEKLSKACLGRKIPEEVKIKISQSLMGRQFSAETIEKIKQGCARKWKERKSKTI